MDSCDLSPEMIALLPDDFWTSNPEDLFLTGASQDSDVLDWQQLTPSIDEGTVEAAVSNGMVALGFYSVPVDPRTVLPLVVVVVICNQRQSCFRNYPILIVLLEQKTIPFESKAI